MKAAILWKVFILALAGCALAGCGSTSSKQLQPKLPLASEVQSIIQTQEASTSEGMNFSYSCVAVDDEGRKFDCQKTLHPGYGESDTIVSTYDAVCDEQACHWMEYEN